MKGKITSRLSYLRATLAACLLLLAASVVLAQSGGGYDLTWNTVDTGGVTFVSAGGYTLSGTAGQPDADAWTGGGYTLPKGPIAVAGGFWHAPLGPGATSVYLPIILSNR